MRLKYKVVMSLLFLGAIIVSIGILSTQPIIALAGGVVFALGVSILIFADANETKLRNILIEAFNFFNSIP